MSGRISFLSVNRLPGSLPPFRSETEANAKTVHISEPRYRSRVERIQ